MPKASKSDHKVAVDKYAYVEYKTATFECIGFNEAETHAYFRRTADQRVESVLINETTFANIPLALSRPFGKTKAKPTVVPELHDLPPRAGNKKAASKPAARKPAPPEETRMTVAPPKTTDAAGKRKRSDEDLLPPPDESAELKKLRSRVTKLQKQVQTEQTAKSRWVGWHRGLKETNEELSKELAEEKAEIRRLRGELRLAQGKVTQLSAGGTQRSAPTKGCVCSWGQPDRNFSRAAKAAVLKHLVFNVHPDRNAKKLQAGMKKADSDAVHTALTEFTQVVTCVQRDAARF